MVAAGSTPGCRSSPAGSRPGPAGGRRFLLAAAAVVALVAGVAPADTGPGAGFPGPLEWPATVGECRPWAYHWWLGSAVDRENLARELRRYRAGGLGGVHIIPIYGARGAESRYLEFLGPRWMAMLDFAVREAGRLGLGVDLTTGTGWCFGGPNIPRELGCRNLVVKRIEFPADGKLPADLRADRVTLQALVARGPGGERREIADLPGPDGVLGWRPPAGGWSLHVLGHRFSGRRVKRAAPGGAGPMINPFSAASMRRYLGRFTAAFEASPVALPRAMYHDSFEYGGNWSPGLPAEFARRRGYRIEGELAALAGEGDPERVARVRCDVSETLSDRVIEDVFPQWVEWCHARGMKTRNQAHGAPANWLDFYALADIPETEMFGHGGPDPLLSRFDEHIGGADRNPLISRFASSAAHVAGKPLVSAETGTWLAEHFCETFEELRCEVDLLFLSGVNHVIYHGCVYSPDDAAWPGWLFYASTQMNPRNPLWREAPALNEYVARCQSILRSGQPDSDVLLYWPIHDAWHRGVGNMSVHNKAALEGPLGEAAGKLWERGHGFDYISDRLLERLRVRGGDILGPAGVRWRVLVVPDCERMPPTTLATLLRLAGEGATVVFARLPGDVPGLGRLEERRRALRALLEPLLPAPPGGVAPPVEVRRGAGRVLVGDLEKALESAGVRRETLVDHRGLKFIRRRHEEGRHYFLVHHGLEPLDRWIALATPARSAVVLDPMTGKTGVAELRRRGDVAEVRLRLEPGHSIFLRTFEEKRAEGPAWTWPEGGRAVMAIEGPWEVEFIAGGPELPRPRRLEELRSWTDGDDAAARAFAGTARYRATFDLPPRLERADRGRLLLDLGEVRHVARVRLNGEDLGVLIQRPHRLGIPAKRLRARDNRLEVEVTNLAANRIRDLDRRKVKWKVFHDANVVNIRYRPLDASNWPLFESGLLGPVRLLAPD